MNCLFCNAAESCLVELLAWDAKTQRARDLLLQGVCVMHATETAAHPNDPTVRVLHPYFEARRDRLAALHRGQFPEDELPLRFGQRYFPLDSLEGAMVRAARDKRIDRSAATVHAAPAIEVERVPDLAALAEVIRDASKN